MHNRRGFLNRVRETGQLDVCAMKQREGRVQLEVGGELLRKIT